MKNNRITNDTVKDIEEQRSKKLCKSQAKFELIRVDIIILPV